MILILCFSKFNQKMNRRINKERLKSVKFCVFPFVHMYQRKNQTKVSRKKGVRAGTHFKE